MKRNLTILMLSCLFVLGFTYQSIADSRKNMIDLTGVWDVTINWASTTRGAGIDDFLGAGTFTSTMMITQQQGNFFGGHIPIGINNDIFQLFSSDSNFCGLISGDAVNIALGTQASGSFMRGKFMPRTQDIEGYIDISGQIAPGTTALFVMTKRPTP